MKFACFFIGPPCISNKSLSSQKGKRPKKSLRVIFGATNQNFIPLVLRTCPDKKIAVAGRTEEKLVKSLEVARRELGNNVDVSGVGIIIADSGDDESIREMCRQTRVVVNCVGPYILYGEQVIFL